MKLIIDETTGTERSETRTEILARHARMVDNHAQGMTFLASIHGEIGDWAENERMAKKEQREEAARLADLGLTTEVNTNKELMPVADIVERCSAILARHNGFKDGFHRVEDRTGYNRHMREIAAGDKSDESEE